jgi:hypothetical protein
MKTDLDPLLAKRYDELPKAVAADVDRGLCQVCGEKGNFYFRNGPLRVLCTEHEEERAVFEFWRLQE